MWEIHTTRAAPRSLLCLLQFPAGCEIVAAFPVVNQKVATFRGPKKQLPQKTLVVITGVRVEI